MHFFKKGNKKFSQSLVLLSVFLFVGVVFLVNYDEEKTLALNPSVEVGLFSTSPSGESGGFAIPASKGSPHYGQGGYYGQSSYYSQGSYVPPPTFGNNCSGSLNEGGSCTLSWSCFSSISSSGVNFSTGGETSGSAEVSPTATTEYTVICSSGGQTSQTITVFDPELSISANPERIRSGETSVISWSATDVDSCSVSEDNPNITDSFSGLSGSQTTSALGQETTYTLSCSTEAGSVSSTVTVELLPLFQEF